MTTIVHFMGFNGAIDRKAWLNDIETKLLVDMHGSRNGFTTRGLCFDYFGNNDWDRMALMGHQMQRLRRKLTTRQTPLLLANKARIWHIIPAHDQAAARDFLVECTRRTIRNIRRLEEYAEIAHNTYQLPLSDPLFQAIQGTESTTPSLRSAL